MIVDDLLMDAQNLLERLRMTRAFKLRTSTHYVICLMQLLKDSYTALHGQKGTAIRLLALASRLSHCTN